MFEKYLRALLRQPVVVAVTLACVVAACLAASKAFQVDLFPTLEFPVLSVVAQAPAFPSLEMERQVALPIENALSGVLGVYRVRAVIATGIANISAYFQWGADMLSARQLLTQALYRTTGQIPRDVDVSVESLSATLGLIESYALRGGTDPVALRDLAEYDLKPRLQGVLGVYRVVVSGGQVREFAVYPNPVLMIENGVFLDDIKTALAENNILASPGIVNSGPQEFTITSNGQFTDAAELENLVVAVKQGYPIRVKDIGKVAEAYQIPRDDSSEKGKPAVLINIYKQPRYDTLSVAAGVNKTIRDFVKSLPPGYTVHNYYDQAQLVGASIGSVKEAVYVGGILVVIVLALFLRDWKTTLAAITSIPISIIAALGLMRLFKVGLNIMSLGGLAVGTGIIVDDAVVVLENIFRWLSAREEGSGLSSRDAIVGAAREVVRPVVVSTLTNIGIFLPMVFIAGFAGRLFAPIGLTVTFALLASLVVALSVIPLLADQWLTQTHLKENDAWVNRVYQKPLGFALRRPYAVIGGAVACVVLTVFAFRHLDLEFLPSLDEGAVLLNTAMPPGTSLAETKRVGVLFEKWLAQMPGVVTVARHTGHAAGTLDVDGVNHSDVTVKLLPKSQRPMPIESFLSLLRRKSRDLTDVQVEYLMPLEDKINDAMGSTPFDIGVAFFGADLDELHRFSAGLLARMHHIKGLIDVHPPDDKPLPAVTVHIDKAAAGRLGIPVRSVFDALRAASQGLTATAVRLVFKSVGVVLHLVSPNGQFNASAMGDLPLRSVVGDAVPLEQVAEIGYGEVPSKIYHEHLQREVMVSANIENRNVRDVASDLAKAVAEMKLPAGYTWTFTGKYKSETDMLGNMGVVLLLAVIIVAVILWFEFRSVIQTLLILSAVPLAGVGAFASLWIGGQSINVSSMIGAMMLIGIVVRNGILMLDYMNAGLAAGLDVKEAAAQAARKRVRPILMTASMTILGLVPIAAGWGTGSELLRPLAIAVIGGMLLSTLLTLVVLPASAVACARWIRPAKSAE
jgi:CzcA family heavy metal efflux pump